MKDLYIDLINHKEGVTANAVILPLLENCMAYAKRTDKICIVTRGVNRKIMNYITAFLMDMHPVVLYCNQGVFYNEQALMHTSEVVAEKFESYKFNELLSRTWKLILDNEIPMHVVRDIDIHIPLNMLAMYDIQVGVTNLQTYNVRNGAYPIKTLRSVRSVHNSDMNIPLRCMIN